MKKFFTTDIPTKLLSLGIAVILWVYLVVFLNPQIETSFTNIPITYSDHAKLSQNGYVITSETVESINLKLRGSRNMLSNVNKNNISAYIDLSGCAASGTYSLPIHVRLPYDELAIIDKNPYNVNIVVDKVISREFDIEVITSGEPKSGVHMDSAKAKLASVTVSGPSEIVKSIDKAVVYADVGGISENKTISSEIKILNSRGEDVKSEFLAVSASKTDVACTVLLEKSVPVLLDGISVPEGYEIHSALPQTVTIIGQKEVLETIDEVKAADYTFTEENTEVTKIPLVFPNGVTAETETVDVVIKRSETQGENDDVNG